MRKFMKGWRQVTCAALYGVAGLALSFYDQLSIFGVDVHQVISENLPTKWVGVAVIATAALIAGLRYITTTAMFHGEPPEEDTK